MLKGTVTEVMLAVFAVLVAGLVLTLIIPRIGGPAIKYYGSEQARTVAALVAGSVNSLDYAGEGFIIQDLGAEWNIQLYEQGGRTYVIARHFDPDNGISTSSTTQDGDIEVLGSVKVTGIPISAQKITIEKESGAPAEVRKA